MSWSTGAPAAQPAYTAETARLLVQYNGDVNALMVEWGKAQEAVVQAVDYERALRKAIFEIKFPKPKEGTQRIELGNGYNLKATFPYTYTLDKDRTEKTIEDIAKFGQRAAVIADRLVGWKPELSIKEYRLLQAENLSDEDKAIKKLIDAVLTVKPGMPQLEIEAPKA